MGALHQIERSQGAALNPHAEQALAHVRTALAELQTHGAGHPAADRAMEAVAGSLSHVHNLFKLTQAPPASPVAAPVPAAVAAVAAAPAARLTPPRPQPAVAAPQQAPHTQQPHAPQQQQQQQPNLGATVTLEPQRIPAPQPAVAPQPAAPQQPHPHAHAPGPQQAAPQQAPHYQAASQPQLHVPQHAPQYQPRPQQAQPVPHFQAPPQHAPAPQAQAPAQPMPPQPQTAPSFQAVADPFARRHSPPPEGPSAGGSGPLRASVPVPSPPPTSNATIVEAALGAHSATNFYKGLSGNDIIDHGGLFVATYMVPRIGSTVRLKVSLPGGYEFEANALVKWARESSDADSAQPGFGAKLTELSPEARQLVYRYVRNREPLFHDDF